MDQSLRSRRPPDPDQALVRLRVFGVILILIGIVFVLRLFYLQIIKADEYRELADSGQVKSLVIESDRGEIYAYNGDFAVPLVLNERQWLVFSDTEFVEDPNEIVGVLAQNGIELSEDTITELDGTSRYIVLSELVDDATKTAIESTEVSGVYFSSRSIRLYTEGDLAAHILGFVNRDNDGQYGIEQQLEGQLEGVDGLLRAVTDSGGVPLAFEQSNIAQNPENGDTVQLTLDVGLQRAVETALEENVASTSALGASAIVLEAETGAVRAMANYPTFDPSDFSSVEDVSLFTNKAISEAVEPGSVMKTLIMAAALDQDVVGVDTTFLDQNQVTVDGVSVSNAIDYGTATRGVSEILSRSLNTGSIYLLRQLGGGEVNEQARTTFYDYLHEDFRLGRKTGIDLPNEVSGLLFGPNQGFGLNIRYANMTFGQGLTVTPIQLAATYGAIFNGGTYYQPYIVESVGEQQAGPIIVTDNILSPTTIEELRELMRRMGEVNYPDVQTPGLEISGKTGTAEVADGQGGYLEDVFTGMFAGYVKNDNKTLIIIVRIDDPKVRFAGSLGAAPVWKDIVNEIVKTGKVR